MSDKAASAFVTWAEFEELNKEHEELDKMVFSHEDLLSKIICSLLDEPSLSQDARNGIQDAYDQIYGEGKYAKKEGNNGK